MGVEAVDSKVVLQATPEQAGSRCCLNGVAVARKGRKLPLTLLPRTFAARSAASSKLNTALITNATNKDVSNSHRCVLIGNGERSTVFVTDAGQHRIIKAPDIGIRDARPPRTASAVAGGLQGRGCQHPDGELIITHLLCQNMCTTGLYFDPVTKSFTDKDKR